MKSFFFLLLIPLNLIYFSGTPEINTEATSNPEVQLSAEEIEAELDEFFCNLSFTSNQNYSCCNTDTNGCACLDITVQGIYNPICASNLVDIWFESIFLCSQDPWSGVSPTIRVYFDLYQACSGPGCSPVNIPITMKYKYQCGPSTCIGTYNRTVSMVVC